MSGPAHEASLKQANVYCLERDSNQVGSKRAEKCQGQRVKQAWNKLKTTA